MHSHICCCEPQRSSALSAFTLRCRVHTERPAERKINIVATAVSFITLQKTMRREKEKKSSLWIFLTRMRCAPCTRYLVPTSDSQTEPANIFHTFSFFCHLIEFTLAVVCCRTATGDGKWQSARAVECSLRTSATVLINFWILVHSRSLLLLHKLLLFVIAECMFAKCECSADMPRTRASSEKHNTLSAFTFGPVSCYCGAHKDHLISLGPNIE